MNVRVLLADRQMIIRQGVRILLEREGVEVVGEAADIDEAVVLASQLKPEVVVLEGYRPGRESLEAARRLNTACPRVKAVILTHAAPWADVGAALQAGVRGYVLTSQRASELAHAVREVARGATYFVPGGPPALPLRPVVAEAKDPLTPRERQVLQLIAEGRTTKEIAQILRRSAKTADAHRTRLMEKLDIHQVAGLVRYAIRRGLIQA